MSGRFYIFEGLDGCGKSTLLNHAGAALSARGEKIQLIRYPSDRVIGRIIREAIQNPQLINPYALMHLFVADGLDMEPFVQRSLNEGYTVLADRHPFTSCYAYQPSMHSLTNVFAVCGPQMFTPAHGIFVLDVPPNVAVERIKARGGKTDMFEANVAEMTVRRARYNSLWSLLPNVAILDGTQSVDVNLKAVTENMNRIDKIIFARN